MKFFILFLCFIALNACRRKYWYIISNVSHNFFSFYNMLNSIRETLIGNCFEYACITKAFLEANGYKNDLKHELGVISMARTFIKDSATTQFFICVAPCDYLDGEYAAFGKVSDEESLKNAIWISEEKTHSWRGYDDIPDEPIVIKTISRI